MILLSETRERFLRAILADVPAERIAEVHFFPPIKQGGVESGIAVVAAWPDVPARAEAPPPTDAPDALDAPDATSDDESNVSTGDVSDTNELPTHASTERHVVYTARYRHTLKGPDRGKWETSIVAEADAPLVTVDAVVRGVQRRSGDVDDPTKMGGDEVRALIPPSATS
jgi:hypothetical protein